ncbi:hypothetical protein AB0942_07440 [Streptomyces nodosus]|uniref:hypothetical protein n=1 Tax=Streptomyces nodosus TaxID=40318 RepID=UPI00345293AA
MVSFPTDYREFVSTYGAGSFEDSLFISIPRPGNLAAPLTVGRLPHDVLESESLDDWQDPGAGSQYSLTDIAGAEKSFGLVMRHAP